MSVSFIIGTVGIGIGIGIGLAVAIALLLAYPVHYLSWAHRGRMFAEPGPSQFVVGELGGDAAGV